MARRKSKRVQVKKVTRARLDRAFACPFCNEEASVECKLDRSKQTGTAKCRVCQAGYQTVINCKYNNSDDMIFTKIDLSEPVDVFAEWVDAIDAQSTKKESRKQKLKHEAPTISGGAATSNRPITAYSDPESE